MNVAWSVIRRQIPLPLLKWRIQPIERQWLRQPSQIQWVLPTAVM
jgi:hypothetical protein